MWWNLNQVGECLMLVCKTPLRINLMAGLMVGIVLLALARSVYAPNLERNNTSRNRHTVRVSFSISMTRMAGYAFLVFQSQRNSR